MRKEREVFGACTEGIIHTLVHCMLEKTHRACELDFIRFKLKVLSVTAGKLTLRNRTA